MTLFVVYSVTYECIYGTFSTWDLALEACKRAVPKGEFHPVSGLDMSGEINERVAILEFELDKVYVDGVIP